MATIRRVRTVFTGVAGTPWYSNMYFATSGGTAADSVANVDAFWTTLAAQINTAVTGTVEGDVAIIESTTGEITSVESVTDGTIDFTGSGNVLPPANQGMINLNTNTYAGGRQIRGKLYIPGLVVGAQNSDGTVAAAYYGAWVSVAGALKTSASTTGVWVVYSPTHHMHAAIESVTPKTTFAVMRSRRD
jgi:hypothetical protein